MSLDAMTWVFEHSEASGNERLVLLALADTCDEHGTCWPSVAFLQRKTRVGDSRTVQRCLRRLEDAGRVRVMVGGGPQTNLAHRTNRYWLVKDAEADRKPVENMSCPGELPGGRGGEMPGGPPGSTPTTPLAAHPPGPLAGDPPEPSVEPSINQIAPTAVDAVDISDLRAAVLEACAIDPAKITRTAEGIVAKVVRDLVDVGATPGEISKAAKRYRERFPMVGAPTPAALAKHWPMLSSSPALETPTSVPSVAAVFGRSLGLTEGDWETARAAIGTEYADDENLRMEAIDAYQRTRSSETVQAAG